MSDTPQTDEHILEIAAQLFSQHNGEGFSMERLAEKTGVSRATLYRRFGGRTALLQRLADERGLSTEELTQPDIPTRILVATRTVLGEYGFGGTTIELIAAEAGVGPATVYRHFGSKEDLLKAFIQHMRPSRIAQQATLHPTGDIEADLTNIALEIIQSAHDNSDILRLGLSMIGSKDVNPVIKQFSQAPNRTLYVVSSYFTKQIEAGRLQPHDPQELALAFTGMVMSFAIFGKTFYDILLEDPQHTAQFITQLFLHGVRQGENQ